jgi:tRNA dimethylallyltransferase
MTRPLLIFGPTASGKSAYALAQAAERPSLIVNADSMQVYADLRVLTARPSPADEAAAPHALYGHVDGAEAYSTGRYLRDLAPVLARAAAEGRRPIVVGGTGLYFRAILHGLSPIPEIPAEIRARWRGHQADTPPAALHALLAARDPETAARLRPTDPQRVVRALEVLDATGRPLSRWQAEPGRPLLDAAACTCVVIAPPRQTVLARVDARFDAMVAAGACDEVARLVARGLDPGLPVMRALGVPPLAAHLSGAVDLASAVATAKADTRAYVRRQLTWLRRNMASWKNL